MSHYHAVKLVRRPEKALDASLFEKVSLPIPEPAEGQLLVRQSHMSLDPAMIGWMSADTESYIPPVALGEVMRSSGVGEVVASRHPDFAVGERVMGMFGWTQYALSSGAGITKIDAALPAEMVLSVLALPGLTATQGLLRLGKPKAGETLVVTGAAGSVGSLVGQLAKAEGLRVIGVVGSEDKAQWVVDTLGFDGAINYKTDDLAAKLAELTPNGVDLFFENTGGPIQQHIFGRMNAHGRIIVCGLIADYLSDTPAPGPSWLNIIKKRLTIQGFTMPDHWHEIPELIATLLPYVQSGKLQYRAHVLEGLDAAMEGLPLLVNGGNQGKLMVAL
ncbi:NADP-dependent oxidoreductase [Gallaecimonas xiamenensis]|uniref:Alcohol dehydrogenase n=1 Tax=Gallaecimonas xiamenensis 3-C-1 TaxID=745411 RepID=K2JPI6_9GAMM|nr:NADP-dependent oxidoreductase [Gallaecimonas xiamenensis]EKE77123.1 alcohol dehydrogenase [Gallaecimonas xiamenensis 3-C-1]